MISVAPVAATAAAHALTGLQHLDPRGMLAASDLQSLCDRGQCFEAAGDGAKAVYVLHVANGVAWCSALAGDGAGLDLCAVVDAAITEQAKGLRRVAFQTARPGLVRKMSRLGYHVTGWVMAKELDQCSVATAAVPKKPKISISGWSEATTPKISASILAVTHLL